MDSSPSSQENQETRQPEPSGPPQPQPPPSPPPLPPNQSNRAPGTLNAIRQTYMNLFNQILDNSININCICKTTTLRRPSGMSPAPNKKFKHNSHKKIFDYDNFLSDEEDDDDESSNELKKNETDTTADLGSAFAYSYGIGSFLRDSDYDEVGLNQNLCDLSCFEKMRFVHAKLKESVIVRSQQTYFYDNSRDDQFERLWMTFKFLSKCPTSCDYYGTTIFHYAATDENPELLKRCLRKFSDGVKCIDSKGSSDFCCCCC